MNERIGKRRVSLKRTARWIVVPSITLAIGVLILILVPQSKFGWNLFGAAILLFLYYGWRTMVEERLLEDGTQTTGKVVSYLPGHRGSVEVEFEVNGSILVSRCSNANLQRHFKPGEKVTVFFDPKKPNSFMILEGAPFDVHA